MHGTFKMPHGLTSFPTIVDDRRRGRLTLHLPHVSLAALVLGLAALSLVTPPAVQGQATIEDPNAAAWKELKRLLGETQKLRAAGKTAEAITAAEAMLVLERKVLPADDPDLAVSLGWLAGLHGDRDDFAAAVAARREARDILRKRLDESDRRVVDARQALEDAERLAGMAPEQRARLAEADRLNGTVAELYRAGKHADAVPPAMRKPCSMTRSSCRAAGSGVPISTSSNPGIRPRIASTAR